MYILSMLAISGEGLRVVLDVDWKPEPLRPFSSQERSVKVSSPTPNAFLQQTDGTVLGAEAPSLHIFGHLQSGFCPHLVCCWGELVGSFPQYPYHE